MVCLDGTCGKCFDCFRKEDPKMDPIEIRYKLRLQNQEKVRGRIIEICQETGHERSIDEMIGEIESLYVNNRKPEIPQKGLSNAFILGKATKKPKKTRSHQSLCQQQTS